MDDKTYSTSFSFDEEVRARIESNLIGKESISQFAYNAAIEKCNRMEKRNDEARKAVFRRDVELFRPIIEEVVNGLN